MAICIKENQAQSYFYLCGIKPIREVKISEGITLMPATSTPNPDDMIDSIMKSNHASEVELGVLIATLRMTTSQIRIEGAVGKELAVKTWNVQQICVMMSAILNCDLACCHMKAPDADLLFRNHKRNNGRIIALRIIPSALFQFPFFLFL